MVAKLQLSKIYDGLAESFLNRWLAAICSLQV